MNKPPFAVATIAASMLATWSLPASPAKLDPVVTDGDKYRVVLENAYVRVLRYHDLPGQKTHRHHHPKFVVVALSPFRRKITLPDGATRIKEFEVGEILWNDEQSHVGENVGTVPSDALVIELKAP